MITPIFQEDYSRIYDTIYNEKDYESECSIITALYEKYSTLRLTSILDLGCGTGNHAIPLVKRGYHVVGVDISSSMLSLAKEKALGANLQVEFIQSDIKKIELTESFDLVIVMFAVLGYQLTNEDILSTLTTIRKNLKKGGLIICDVWFGPAVLNIKPSDKVLIKYDSNKVRWVRLSQGKIDLYNHSCDVSFHCFGIKDKLVISEITENHIMRFFFPQELALFLQSTGFEMVHLGAFPDYEEKADEKSWNVVVVGR